MVQGEAHHGTVEHGGMILATEKHDVPCRILSDDPHPGILAIGGTVNQYLVNHPSATDLQVGLLYLLLLSNLWQNPSNCIGDRGLKNQVSQHNPLAN